MNVIYRRNKKYKFECKIVENKLQIDFYSKGFLFYQKVKSETYIIYDNTVSQNGLNKKLEDLIFDYEYDLKEEVVLNKILELLE